MGGHHLILGKMVDYLSGKTIEDTHDERYRQKIAQFLVQQKGYAKDQIESQRPLIVSAGENRGKINVDFCVHHEEKVAMIIKYGPGSIVTRHRPTLAMTRLVEPYRVPLAVVTNGEDLHVLDGEKGTLLSEGFDSLPSLKQITNIIQNASFEKISKKRAEMEARIVYCYEIDGSCPCDNTVCKLE